jgi:hypothetical protein
MTWLTPWLGGIAAAIAVPALVILYFLKLRRRDVEVSSTFLWKKAVEDLQANAPFQRLRRNILLLLQLIAVAAVCIALAQPNMKAITVTGTRHVILIDRSASMASLDEPDGRGGTISRLDAAKQRAIALVSALRDGGMLSGRTSADEAMVITFDSQAEVRQAFTSDTAVLRAAIEGITPGESVTRIEEAVRLARAHQPRRIVEDNAIEGLTAGTPLTIHVISDGRIADAAEAKPGPEDTLRFHRVGTPEAANLGIVNLRAARDYDNPARLTVYVSLTNSGKLARDTDVELMIDGVSARIKLTKVPAATEREGTKVGEVIRTVGTAGVVFQVELAQGATIEVRLREPGTALAPVDDALAIDDRAYLVVPPAKRLAVLTVSRVADSWLDVALSGLPLSRLVKIDPTRFEQWTREGRLGEFDVIVLEGWVPSANADSTPGELPPGSYLVFGGIPGGLGIRDVGVSPLASVLDWKRDHPIMRPLLLDRLRVLESRRAEIEPGSGAVVVATTSEGPAVIEASSPGTHAIVVPFAIDKSTWAIDPSFVVFVAASVQYLGEDVGVGATIRDMQPGMVITDRLPSGAEGVEVLQPSGRRLPLQIGADGRFSYGPLPSVGVYEVSWRGPAGPTDRRTSGGAARRYAVNLADDHESDIVAADIIDTASQTAVADTEAATRTDRRLWPWLLAAVLCVIMFEWFIYNRKVSI